MISMLLSSLSNPDALMDGRFDKRHELCVSRDEKIKRSIYPAEDKNFIRYDTDFSEDYLID